VIANRIRILHVIQNLNYGGMERVLSDIVLRCDRARFESHVLCLQYLGRFSAGLDSGAVLHVAGKMSPVSMFWPRSLARQIESIAPDVVHSHSGVWYKASFAARLAGVRRVVHTEHGRATPDPFLHRLVDSIGARRTDVVVAVSTVLASQLQRDLGIPAHRLQVIANGVDTEEYSPRVENFRVRSELAIALDPPIIGSIGRLERIKGYDLMIDAFAILRQRGLDRGAMLVIAGEGSERAELDQRLRSLGLEDSVLILGWRDDVHDLHAAFTLFTMSSRSEGTSISLLEAMSAGLPPVVTDVGGNAAVLGDTLRHRLVPSENPGALATAWGELLSDPGVRRREGVTARQRVVDSFGLDAMVTAYQRVYVPGPAAAD
jgi:glycosyltransferase involved in cell wall biosynthesis